MKENIVKDKSKEFESIYNDCQELLKIIYSIVKTSEKE